MSIRSLLALLCFVAASAHAEGKLALYNWGDYINPQILEKFGKEYDVKVSLDTYASNEEMLAKIQAGATGYDIVWPSVHMHDIMSKLDLLEKTEPNKMPGFANIDKAALRAKSDPKGEYCVPYAWGTVGIVYNRKKIPQLKSWKEFFEYAAKNPKKVTMLDDMRETLGVGLIMNGKSVNSRNPADIKAAQELILKQKPNIGAFSYEVIPLVQSGDMHAAHYFVGAMIYVLEKPDTLALRDSRGGRDHVPGGHLRAEVRPEQGQREEVPGVHDAAGDLRAEHHPAEERHREHQGHGAAAAGA